MRTSQSQAYADIQPPAFTEHQTAPDKPKRKPKAITAKEAADYYAGMHAAVNYENHLAAVSR